MENWLIYTLIGVGAFIVSLFFEDVREFYIDQLETTGEGILYLISFEWLGDLWDIISSGFEDISEFSTFGIILGVGAVLFIYYFRNLMLEPFLQYFPPIPRIFWMITTYLLSFVVWYIIGKGLESN